MDWTPEHLPARGPKYLAIAAALAGDIESGRLAPGDRLPPQRSLAGRLGVDLTTITKAYNAVRSRGLIEGDGRRGSFVRKAAAPSPTEPEAPDAGMNLPPEPPGGTFAERYRRAVAELLTGPAAPSCLRYQPGGGRPADRRAAARHFERRGMTTSEDQVVIAGGGQNALHAVLLSACRSGDAVCAARFAYPGFLALARRAGLNLLALPSDEEGLDPDALDGACRARAVRAVYVVPTNDNPTTRTMGETRRRAVAAVADRHGIAVIEDDAYGQLPAAPLPPIAAHLPHGTWHIASVSKIVSPGLRVAHVRTPSVADALRVAGAIHETAIMAPPLNAAIVSGWLEDGTIAALTGEVRREARARQTIVADVLGAVPYRAHPDGYHLWLPLPDDAGAGRIADALRGSGLSAIPSAAFATDVAEREAALRVSFGGGAGPERLARAFHLLGALLDQGAQGAPLI